jgi:hypothetical protein
MLSTTLEKAFAMTFNTHKLLLATMLATSFLALSLTPQSFAATQGTLGATSSGSVAISITKTARARISNLNDLTLPAWEEGSGAVNLTDDVCVYSTRPNGSYRVTASGSGGSNAFSLANGANLLNYSVTWNAGGVGALANTGTTLTTGVASAAFNNASTTSPTCTAGDTARLIVGVSALAMTSAVEGSYVGTLTLLVAPN